MENFPNSPGGVNEKRFAKTRLGRIKLHGSNSLLTLFPQDLGATKKTSNITLLVNTLGRVDIHTTNELAKKTENDLRAIKGVGKKTGVLLRAMRNVSVFMEMIGDNPETE